MWPALAWWRRSCAPAPACRWRRAAPARSPCRGPRSPACRRWRCCWRSGAGAPSAGVSAWAWKSSASVSRLSIVASLRRSATERGPDVPRREGIVLSARVDISANRGRFAGHIGALPPRPGPTVTPCCPSSCSRLSRASPPTPSPGGCCACWAWPGWCCSALLGVAAPAGAAGGAALDAALAQRVRALALGKAGESGGVAGRGDSSASSIRGCASRRARTSSPTCRRACACGARRASACAARSGPTPWNVYLPITVKVFGRALVVPAGACRRQRRSPQRDLAAGRGRSGRRLRPRRGRPAPGRRPDAGAHAQAPARPCARPISRAAPVVRRRRDRAGGRHRRRVQRSRARRQALSTGIEGQPARVRTESGRVLTGLPAGERRVEVAL